MESEIDAIFYRLIHQLSSAPRTGKGAEQRGQTRLPFAMSQRIAPWEGRGCPDEVEFFEVQCHDLTQRGFSFFLPHRPQFTSLVVEFGTAPDLIYVVAQVLHLSPVLVHPSGLVEHLRRDQDDRGDKLSAAEERPEPKVLVGCRFTRRMPRPVWVESVRR